MNKVAILGDLHIGTRNDNKIFQTIINDFLSSLVDDLVKRSINELILLGDVFDRRKFINFETLYYFKKAFLDKLRDNDINVYMITGNHDVYFKNTNKINSLDILITNSEYPNVTKITNNAESHIINGVSFLFVPWMNAENTESILSVIDKTDAKYMIAHLDLVGFEMHKGALSDRGHVDVDSLYKFDAVFTGHYHTKSSKGNIHYLGTPYQTSWNDYGEDKGWHILDLDTKEMEFVSSNSDTFKRIIYDDVNDPEVLKRNLGIDFTNKYVKVVIKRKTNARMFESLIAKLETSGCADLNIIDDSNYVNEIDNDESVVYNTTLEIIESYVLYDLETDLDKKILHNNISKLYQIALEDDNDD